MLKKVVWVRIFIEKQDPPFLIYAYKGFSRFYKKHDLFYRKTLDIYINFFTFKGDLEQFHKFRKKDNFYKLISGKNTCRDISTKDRKMVTLSKEQIDQFKLKGWTKQ